MIVGIFLLAIFAIGAVSAAEDIDTTDNVLAIDSVDEIEITQEGSGELLCLAGDSSGEILEEDGNSYSGGSSTVDSHFYGTTMTELSNFIRPAVDGDVIYFENDITSDQAFENTTNGIQINKCITINGNGHTIDLKGLTPAFFIKTTNVVLNNLTIKNGRAFQNGGVITSSSVGSCTITNCIFMDNAAEERGGVIYLNSADSCNIINSNFINNQVLSSSIGYGGSIFAVNHINVRNCTFTNNKGNYGGAIYLKSTGDLAGCNFVGNTAAGKGFGGAIYAEKYINLNNCNFNNNDAKYGGAVYSASSGSCDLTGCNFVGNTAIEGAGVYSFNRANLNNCNFTDNTISNNVDNKGARGAAFYGSGSFNNCNFINNHAQSDKSYGGGLYIKQDSTIINCNFEDNTAEISGGAVYAGVGTTLEIINSNFINNRAQGANGYGGAVFSNMTNDLISNCNFTNNYAKNTGGAIYSPIGDCNLNDCNFYDNVAENIAGAIYSVNGVYELTDCDFTNNAAESGGAFYGGGTLNNCNFTSNSATANDGGAVYSLLNSNMNNCIFVGNSAGRNGGATYNKQTSNTNNCIFNNNNAGRNGGAAFNVNANNCDFVNNNAQSDNSGYGGAMYQGDASNCYFVDCSAAKRGGAIANGNAHDSIFINCDNPYGVVYNGTSENCMFTESPVLYCPDITVDYGEAISVPVRILDKDGSDVNGLPVDVKVYEGNKLIDSFATESGSSVTLDVDAGSYIIALTSKYIDPINARLVVNIPKPSPFISAPPVTTQYGKNAVITVNLFSDVPGNVKITINGNTQKAKITNGVATYTVSGLNYGLYPVEISYLGNYKYAADSINTTLKVNKNSPIVSIVANDIAYNENATVTVNLAKNVAGNVRITVNGVTEKVKIVNKLASATFTGLKAGTHDVKVTYAGNINYVAQTKTATLKVVKGTPIISADAPDADYGEDAVISVALFKDVPGNVRVTVNGISERTKITNGEATYTVSGLKTGSYEVTVYYAGNVNYNAQTFKTTLNIVKGTPITAISVNNINVGDTAQINVLTAKNVNGNIRITVNGVTERVRIVNGVATLNVTGLKAGTYDVTAVYAGSTYFNSQTKTATLTVSKGSPGLSFTAVTKSGKTTVTAKIAQDAPGNVKIIVDGVNTYTAKITNGVATYAISGLASGSHTIKVTYGGNYKYTSQSRAKTITV
ncbi:Ig-like domain-containing protein [Methanobrevibacter sp. YE315]|uniref:Ig-like domain-containing protein n=1 Tax=Methanobrevibacter sp. YE315 TaxID=1609968 RepID=UPI001E391623|nr:Ig-like domain-containing protein [Methanobrevibacter sp. YE315]